MHRYLLAIGAAVILGLAAYTYADSTLIVKPSDMKNGETKTIIDDGRTITVTRDGNTTNVKIDDAGTINRLTITREGGRLKITHSGDGAKSFVIGPDRREIVIDGVPMEKFLQPEPMLKPHKMQTVFVCPKDGTTLRVPDAKDDQSFKCPVDGTTMEKKKVHGFQFFFDDHAFDWNS